MIGLSTLLILAQVPAMPVDGASSTIEVAESKDYASAVLGSPWDMDEKDDVSPYLNESGQRDLVKNPTIADGIFTGTSSKSAATGGSAYWHPLFPGYALPGGVRAIMPKNEKIGFNFPIKTADFGCLYIAMKVNSPGKNSVIKAPDQFLVYWWSDYRLNTYGAAYDSVFDVLYPETIPLGGTAPTHGWRLYKVNLRSPTYPLRYKTAAWDSQTEWQGLRIDPTINADVDFAVDWIRLTNCNESKVTVQVPAGANSVYLRPSGTTRNIRIATGAATGSFDIDVQGVMPGTYDIGFGTTTTCCASYAAQSLKINKAPVAEFVAPSLTSGEEYARSAGNAWDFSNVADGAVINADWSYANGKLDIVTPSGPQPAGVDVQVALNVPTPINTNEYRYLTFKMYTEWTSWPYGAFQWQNISQGMIVRVIWTRNSLTSQQGYECDQVTKDIPFNVGWQVYTIDLYDPYDGLAIEQEPSGLPHCPNSPETWKLAGSVIGLRVDPNENITCNPNYSPEPVIPCSAFRQQLDWVRLTKENVIKAGQVYTVQLSLNKSAADVHLTYYYTTNPAQPKQHAAIGTLRASPQRSQVANDVFIPVAFDRSEQPAEVIANPVSFSWRTTGVSAGTYYVCVEMNDRINTSLQCSPVPVIIE